MTANRTPRQAKPVRGEILDAELAPPKAGRPTKDVTPKDPILWHIIIFGACATLASIALLTFLLGDITMALTISATLLAAIAVRAFRAFDT